MKFVALFPGQGAQVPGMGKSFYDAYGIARETFDEASDVLKRDIAHLVFHGGEKELMRTKNCQVALFVASLAIFRSLSGFFPKASLQGAAGLSLGEYTALAALGGAAFEEALKLVASRAKFMDEACKKTEGAMAALLGVGGHEAEEFVGSFDLQGELFIANYNAPGQIVISGSKRAMERARKRFSELYEGVRTKKMVPLDVHGAFHSGFMQEAGDCLAPFIASAKLTLPKEVFVMNVSAKPPKDIEELREHLRKQVSSSVRWDDSIRFFESGICPDFYLECGPGKVLGGFNKRIGVKGSTISIETVDDIKKLEGIFS